MLASSLQETRFYREVKEEGRQEGLEESRKEGREEGRKEGREEGRKEGREEGRKEGREEGRKEGREEEGRSLVLRLLNRRIGSLPETIALQITTLSIAQIESLAEALLDFQAIADLETWLENLLQ